MSPVTIAGALAQQHAEAMAGIALDPDHPPRRCRSIYGGFTSNVDMKTGSPAFGTPEYVTGRPGVGPAGAAHIGRTVPVQSNVTAANTTDAQAAYESHDGPCGAQ